MSFVEKDLKAKQEVSECQVVSLSSAEPARGDEETNLFIGD